jgi:uncharacterized protein (UPF0333 family)
MLLILGLALLAIMATIYLTRSTKEGQKSQVQVQQEAIQQAKDIQQQNIEQSQRIQEQMNQ